MSEETEKKEEETLYTSDDDGVHTFDMFHVMSRWDVVLGILFIAMLLAIVTYFTLIVPVGA